MLEDITIIRPDGALAQERWVFTFRDGGLSEALGIPVLVVEHYHREQRDTPRKKFRSVAYYNRLRERDSPIKRADVPLPDDVRDEALATFVGRIKVTT